MANKYLEKVAGELYAHATSDEGLHRILSSGGIKSVRHVALESPDQEMVVETLPLPLPILRRTLSAVDANDFMNLLGKNPDKVFLTQGGYLPTYGSNVILKELTHPSERVSLNTIPKEFTTRRQLSVKSNAKIYVPDDKVDHFSEKYPEYSFKSLSSIPVQQYSYRDRLSHYPGKLMRFLGLNKEAQLPITPYSVSSNAFLAGSEGLGLNLDNSDVDIFVPYARDNAYLKGIQKALEKHPELKERSTTINNPDKTTLSGVIDGQDVDLVFGRGEKALAFKDAYLNAKNKLTDEKRQEIIDTKRRLKESWFFPETRYKLYKNQVAKDLGLKKHYF